MEVHFNEGLFCGWTSSVLIILFFSTFMFSIGTRDSKAEEHVPQMDLVNGGVDFFNEIAP
jgi:hypothetical protein